MNGFNVGGVYIDIEGRNTPFINKLEQSRRVARTTGTSISRDFDRATASNDRFNRSLRNTASSLALLAGGVSVGLVTRSVVKSADAYSLLLGRIKLVARETERLEDIEKGIYQTAQRNRSGLVETATLYQRLRQARKELGDAEALEIVDAWQKTLRVSGASASEAASSTLQFAQALSKGKLDGDEFRSILENNAEFANRLTDALGVTRGELYALSEAGKIRVPDVIAALTEDAEGLQASFETMPLTVDQGMTRIQNALMRYVGQTDQSLGASQRFAQGLSLLAENFEEVADAAVLVLGIVGGRALIGGVNALTAGLTAQGQAALKSAQETIASVTADRAKAQAAAQTAARVLAARQAELAHAQSIVRTSEAQIAAAATGRARQAALEANTAAIAKAQAAEAAYQAQLVRTTAVQSAASKALGGTGRAAVTAGIAAKGLQGALAFLGGPVGAAIIATAGAIWGLHEAYEALTGASERVLDHQRRVVEITGELADASGTRAYELRKERIELLRLADAEVEAANRRAEAADRLASIARGNRFLSTAAGSLFGPLGSAAPEKLSAISAALKLVAKDAESARAGIEEAADEAADLSLPRQAASLTRDIAALERELEEATGDRRKYLEDELAYKRELLEQNRRLAAERVAQLDEEIRKVRELVAEMEKAPVRSGEDIEAYFRARASEEDLANRRRSAENARTYEEPDSTASDGSASTGKTVDQLRAEAELEVLRFANDQRAIEAAEDRLDLEKRIAAYKKAGAEDPEGLARADQARIAHAREEAYQRTRDEMEAMNALEAARLAQNIELERSLQRQADIADRTKEYLSAGLSQAEAEKRARDDIAQLDQARAQAAEKALDDHRRALDLEIANLDENRAQVEALEDQQRLRDLIQTYRENELSLAEATARAEADIARIQEARARARARALVDMREEHQLAVARARGDEALVRQLENAARREDISRSLQEQGLPQGAADAEAARRADELSRAEEQGEFREAFKASLREAINVGIQEGDWDKAGLQLAAGLGQHLFDQGIDRLGDFLFNSIFDQGAAAAQGVAQGSAAAPLLTGAMATGGATAAATISAAMISAGGVAASQIALATAASKIPMLPGLATGGPARAGQTYLVGERGPEILRMGSQSGHVTPNHALRGAVSGRDAEGGAATFNVIGASPDQFEQLKKAVRSVGFRVEQVDQSIEPRIDRSVTDGISRGKFEDAGLGS